MLEDLYSRRIIGWDVLEHESADEAGRLVERTCIEHQVDSSKLHLHSDNGGPMKGATMLATDPAAPRRRGIFQSSARERRQPICGSTISYTEVPTRIPQSTIP